MKVKVTTNLDYELKQKIEKSGLSIAQILDEAVRSRLAFEEKDVNQIDINLTKIQLEKVTQNLSILALERSRLDDQLRKAIEKQEAAENERLQKEKEVIESKQVCCVCGELLTHRFHKTKVINQFMCPNCWVTMDNDTYRRFVA